MLSIDVKQSFVWYNCSCGAIWLDRIDIYGLVSMFKVNHCMTYMWYYTARDGNIRDCVHEFMHD